VQVLARLREGSHTVSRKESILQVDFGAPLRYSVMRRDLSLEFGWYRDYSPRKRKAALSGLFMFRGQILEYYSKEEER